MVLAQLEVGATSMATLKILRIGIEEPQNVVPAYTYLCKLSSSFDLALQGVAHHGARYSWCFAEHPYAFGGRLSWTETHEFAASNNTYKTAQIPAAMALIIFLAVAVAAAARASAKSSLKRRTLTIF